MTELAPRFPLPDRWTPALEKGRAVLQTGWQYARPEFLYLSWVLMEVALLTPAVLAFMPWTRFYPPLAYLLWLFLVILIPFNLSRVMSLAGWPVFRQQNIILLSFLATLLISTKVMHYPGYALFHLEWLGELAAHFTTRRHPLLGRDLWLFFLVVILWWRGISIAGRRVDINDIGLRVRVGALILMPLIITLAIFRLPWSPAPFVPLFALASLMAIALTRAEQLEKERSGRNYPMRPRWVLMVFGTSFLIVSLAWALAAAISGEQLPFFLSWLRPLWTAALFTATILFAIVTYLTIPIMALLERMAFFFNTRILNRQPPDPQAAAPPPDNAAEIAEQWSRLLEWLTNPSSQTLFLISRIVLFLILLLVILLVLLLLDRFIRRRRPAYAAGEGPAGARRREEDLEPGGLGRRILRRLGLLRQFRAASVRRLYRQMCRAAAAHGYPRAKAETPYEYLQTLGQAWPEGRPEATLITEAYVRVRYGEVPETEAEFKALREAWNTLEKQKPEELTVREKTR